MSEEKVLPPGWAWATTGDLFEFVTSGSRGWAQYYADRGALFLRIGNLDHGTISRDLSSVQRVQPPDSAEGKRTLVRQGDILISITAELGMIALVPGGLGEAYINQHLALARPILQDTARYLAWFLAAERHGKRQLNEMRRGATKVGLGLDDVQAVHVPLPPLAEQRRIFEAIEQQFTRLDAGVAALKRTQAALKRYRAAVLKVAVEGKLTEAWRAAHPDAEPASTLLTRILAERRARWEADVRARGKDPAKAKYDEPHAPDTAELLVLPHGWCWATTEQLAAPDDYALAIGPFGSNLKVEDYRDAGVPPVFVRNIRSGSLTAPTHALFRSTRLMSCVRIGSRGEMSSSQRWETRPVMPACTPRLSLRRSSRPIASSGLFRVCARTPAISSMP